jgi:hypothetical protein
MKKLILILSVTCINSFSFSQASAIFGLAVKNSPSSTFLGTINPATGVVTNISPASLGINYVSTLGVIDMKKNRYYYETGTNQFVGVDLTTGNVMTNPTITNPSASFFDLAAYNCADSTIYGLARSTGPTNYYLAKINVATGAVNNISTSSIGSGIILTPSTLDPVNKRFYYEDGSFNFVGIDLVTGTVVTNPVISNPSPNANLFDSFVYNCADSTIYGLARKNSTSTMYLAKINPTTGVVTNISPTSINSNGQTSGGATIDQVNKIFYFQDGSQNLIGLSLITGTIISNVPVTNANANSYTNFRSTNLCNCGSVPTGIKYLDVSSAVSVYPNPNSGLFTLQSKTGEDFDIVIYNGLGQLVVEQKGLREGNNIDLNKTGAGVYTIVVITKNDRRHLKMVIE